MKKKKGPGNELLNLLYIISLLIRLKILIYIPSFNIVFKRFISSSGIGFYGAITTENIFTEEDKPASNFISEICIKWENAAQQFQDLDIPVTILSTGVVLSKDDGALQKMNTPLFLSVLGN